MQVAANRISEQKQSEYVSSGGVVCPFCNSEDIAGQDITIDNGIASQAINCNACLEEWTDLYQLYKVTTEYN